MSFDHPSSKPHNILYGTRKAVVWGETDLLQLFFSEIVMAPPDDIKEISLTIKSHTVKRYPGDRGYTIPAHSAKRLNNVPPKMGGALPGNPFKVRNCLADGEPDMSKIWQFRYQGSWLTVRGWAEGAVLPPGVWMYSPSGAPYQVLPQGSRLAQADSFEDPLR